LVRLVPWDATAVTVLVWYVTLLFSIDQNALVTVVEFLAESVDFVGWETSTFSVVVLEVAPASVLIDGVHELGSPLRAEASGEGELWRDGNG